MLKTFLGKLPVVSAHCDAPCGVYDPAQARVEAESVHELTKKMLDLQKPDESDEQAFMSYLHTFARYTAVKEDRAEKAKHHVLVLWTDYFKQEHVEKYPELHELIWDTTKLLSTCKREVNMEHADELMANIQRIHEIFWETKGRDVPWIEARG